MKNKKSANSIGVNIGASKETILEAWTAINNILNSNSDQSTKVVALNTLKDIAQVNNSTVTNCTFTLDSQNE